MLERTARTYGAYLTYAELATQVQADSGVTTAIPFRHWIGSVLGELARQHLKPDEPLLPSLAVRADGSIGDGYLIPIVERGEPEPEDLEAHAADERLRCYRYFGAELPPDGGSPVFTPAVARSRAWASAERARDREANRPRCPGCFLELPLAGECGNCG